MRDTVILGIHNRPGSFSEHWIETCKTKGISYSLYDPYHPDFLTQVRGVKAFAWHWSHNDPGALIVAKHITKALENMGISVFPNDSTCWHFDDKIAQKYLLESIGAPIPKTWVFFDKEAGNNWIKSASFPVVFKLHSGAGAQNVRLVRDKKEALELCSVAFGKGFKSQPGYFKDIKHRINKPSSLIENIHKIGRAPKVFFNIRRLERDLPRCKGYIYFQEFMPDNQFDIRVTVIGDRAFGFIRYNRPGDFRASGSGRIDYDKSKIDPQCIRIAFDTAKKAGAQSLAHDFLKGRDGQFVIGEISYGYQDTAVYNCPGHWDSKMNWHEGHVWPQDAILEDLIQSLDHINK